MYKNIPGSVRRVVVFNLTAKSDAPTSKTDP